MPRLKKLTDYTYSPTNPSSEDAIRQQIDDSIQEVYDASPRAGDTVNLSGNQTISDVKTFSSSPIVPTPTSASQVANKSYVDSVAISATIPLDSLTDDYLASAPGNIKPRVATLETDFATAQSDIANLETDIDIITTAIQDSGTVNAIVVDTLGTFDLTKNGNVTPFIIPLFTNTSGTVNVNMDGQGNKLVKKANDSGVMVALEVGDIKKNVPIQLIRDSVNDFFIFAPKWGSNIKSIQKGVFNSNNLATKTVTITPVDTLKSIIIITIDGISSFQNSGWVVDFLDSSNIKFDRQFGTATNQNIGYTVIEFNNVKSKQKGSIASVDGFNGSVTIPISTIDPLKSICLVYSKADNGTAPPTIVGALMFSYTLNASSISVSRVTDFGTYKATSHYWQVLEFK